MKILLDTNFILTCIKQKIDFDRIANEIVDEEIKWILPEEVQNELEKLSKRKGMRTIDKESAKLSLEFLKSLNPELIKLNNKNVDDGIVNYINSQKNKIILATLDKELKKRINSKILTIRTNRYLELF
ncbi:MAG: hypothetical protein ACOYT4_03685 [Nanoarchaeota archaeon]